MRGSISDIRVVELPTVSNRAAWVARRLGLLVFTERANEETLPQMHNAVACKKPRWSLAGGT